MCLEHSVVQFGLYEVLFLLPFVIYPGGLFGIYGVSPLLHKNIKHIRPRLAWRWAFIIFTFIAQASV